VNRYHSSGMTREQYSRDTGVAKSTLDRYLSQWGLSRGLVRVRVAQPEPCAGFTLLLANGRRIKSGVSA
jgi:hypothetical protein